MIWIGLYEFAFYRREKSIAKCAFECYTDDYTSRHRISFQPRLLIRLQKIVKRDIYFDLSGFLESALYLGWSP